VPCFFSRSDLHATLAATFSSHERIAEMLGEVTLPAELRTWLSRLKILAGVPINYLVPDERMLPPESIRFFYLDMNWIDALIDGAFSIGRNLTEDSKAAGMNLDRAVGPHLQAQSLAGTAQIRAAAFGVPTPALTLDVVSGYVLRSSIVSRYPGLGTFAYDAAKNPLPLLRFERLGPASDTLICLVDGDVAQADICEPPEALHYGIDRYDAEHGAVQASKEIHTFDTDPNGNVTLNPDPVSEPIGSYFRAVAPRTLRLAPLGGFIASFSKLTQLNAAQMGFEMNQGVGLVSFLKRLS
jgi:hypothetical protein